MLYLCENFSGDDYNKSAMQTSPFKTQIKPTIWQMIAYGLLCFGIFTLLQFFFHYQSHVRDSSLQCSQLLESSALNINYRNSAGIKQYFTDSGDNWIYSWVLQDSAQGFEVSGLNIDNKNSFFPKIKVQCTQANSQNILLTLTTRAEHSKAAIVSALFFSFLITTLLVGLLLLLKIERKANKKAINDFFQQLDPHLNQSGLVNNFEYPTIAEQLNEKKNALFNYIDDMQLRLHNVDEEFTEQLILSNRELEERYAYLEIQTRDLKSLTTKKSSFFANLSHDFRTPLYTLQGYIRLLNDNNLTTEQRKYTRALEGAYKNLSELVTNFLSMSRLEAGSMNVENSSTNLSKMLSEVIDGMRFLLPENNNLLLLDIARDLPHEIILDKNKLRQILTNIITNAAKYTQNGVIYIHCESSIIDNKSINLNISVSDTGKGISKEDLKTIFDPYTRLERDRTTIPGTGLGLGICKELCTIINAELEVDSKINHGTIFNVNLVANFIQQDDEDQSTPLETKLLHIFTSNSKIEKHLEQFLHNQQLKVVTHKFSQLNLVIQNLSLNEKILCVLNKNNSHELEQILKHKSVGEKLIISIDKDELSAESRNAITHFISIPNIITTHSLTNALALMPINSFDNTLKDKKQEKALKGYQILLAEDNDLNRFIIEDTLNKLGAKVISCADGAAALDLYLAGKYSAILLDAHMPKLGGTEVTKKIRQQHSDNEIAIIGITASTSSTEYQHFIQSGMSDCLIKPINEEELVAKIISLGSKLDTFNQTNENQDSNINPKIQALFKQGCARHIEKLSILISEDINLPKLHQEIHKLIGTLSISDQMELRTQCQASEEQIKGLIDNVGKLNNKQLNDIKLEVQSILQQLTKHT